MSLSIFHNTGIINANIHLPSSKSESNRALIINALTGNRCDVQNISNARDTQTMMRLLASKKRVLDVIDAGTTMRFLTAYYSLKEVEKEITGTERMCERPIGILVDALREIGASIQYLNVEGYPPLLLRGIQKQLQHSIKIKGDVSSQFISALLMIAPSLPLGLSLELTGEIGSKPYIMMTLKMMEDFGIQYTFVDNIITITHQEYVPAKFYVESDWSGASYWFSVVALAKEAELELVGLKRDSLQADSEIVNIMRKLGVDTEFKNDSIVLNKIGIDVKEIEIDFSNCPDIAQTVAVVCAAKGIKLTMKGIESLKIKETDRLLALKNELGKFGVEIKDLGHQTYLLYNKEPFIIRDNTLINTYKDHRMAMAFAPLGLIGKVLIEDKEVIVKSYPDFWRDMKNVGFTIIE